MGACYALTSLMETIHLEFLQPNPRVRLGIDDENAVINSLVEKLSGLVDSLWWKKPSGGGRAVIREMEMKIRDYALKAEDDIETQLSNILTLSKHDEREYEHKALGELLRILREAADEAEELSNNIINATCNKPEDEGDSYALSSIHHRRLKLANNLHRHNNNNVMSMAGGSSRCSSMPEEIIMIGPAKRDFIDWTMRFLLRTNHKQARIAISGMAGIGKTTLARMVYIDPLVASNFDILAWTTVSHEYNEHQILCDLLHSMTPTINFDDNGGSTTLFQLKDQLYTHLKDKRYFIVLDDIWTFQAFYHIQQWFLDDSCGSVLLLTTQFKDLAVENTNFCYTVELLNANNSWDLFCNNLSLKVENMAPKFVEIAKHVVQQCDGLPQSIVAVAKHLSKCNNTLEEWKKVQKEIDSLGTLYCDPHLTSKLTLTFNQLSHYVKDCFLYLAVFPKGSDIQVKKLLSLWIAEGFVEPLWYTALEDIACGYLDTLIESGFVLVRTPSCNGDVKVCRMHHALYSFCTREAQKEGLFCAVKNIPKCSGWLLNSLANSCRWLSLRPHNLDYYVLFSSNNLRSLFFFHGDPVMFRPFKLLRVLDLSQSPIIKRLTLYLEGFVFLRYLCVPQWFDGLDCIVSSNRNLQVLIISGVESKLEAPTTHLPSRIWESPRIRHLELGNFYTIDPPSMVYERLQSLFWVSPNHFKRKVYTRFPNLETLKIFCKDVFEPCRNHHGSCRSPSFTLAKIKYLSRLKTLKVVAPYGSITSINWFVFPVQLTKLSLSRTNLSVNALGVISQLPLLVTLVLRNDFCDKVWELDTGFPELKHLHLEARNLERWVAHANHFPMLEKLVLRCYCLEEIPRGFVEHPFLLEIMLEQCSPSVVSSAKWMLKSSSYKNNRTLNLYVDGEYWYTDMEEYSDEPSQHTNMEEPAEEDLAELTPS